MRWLALAAFCLGVAAGSKYQALVFLPLVALFVVRHERRPKAWALALLCF
jgi:membrane protein implicated in regulation of membrane protease activity